MATTTATMQVKKTRLLLVDPDPDVQRVITKHLAEINHQHFELERVSDCAEAADRAREAIFAACLINGTASNCTEYPELLARSEALGGTPVIVLTETREAGLSAIDLGASDYLEWGNLTPDLVERSIRYVIQRHQLTTQAARLASERSARAAIQRRSFRLKLLSEAAGELLGVDDPAELLGRLYSRLAAHLGLDCYLHYLVDAESERLVLHGHAGISDDVRGKIFRVDLQAVLAESAEANPASHRDGLETSEARMAAQLGLSAYFAYPLLTDGSIAGTLAFGSRRRSRFSSAELVFLRTICHYVATAMERKRLTEQLTDRAARLTDSEQRFRVVAETVPDFLLSGSADGSCDFCNQQFCDYTGMSREQACGFGWTGAMHPEDVELLNRSWKELSYPSELLETEYRFRARDGGYRWFLARLRGVCGPDGQVARWVGSCADIDDLKQAENALRENQARLHQAATEAERRAMEAEEGRRILDAIMDHVPIGIAVADAPDGIRLVSRMGKSMLAGADAGHCDSESTAALDEIASPTRDGSPMARALHAGETLKNYELNAHADNGRNLALLCSSGPIRDRSGRITGAVVTWVDIAERKRAERVLKQSERQFRAVFETSPACIVIVDDDMRMTKINPAAFAAFGAEVEGMLGQSMSALVRPTCRVEEIRRALLQTGRYAGEMQIERPDGEVRSFDVGAAFSFMPGRHLLVFHDTTDRRRMEEQLRESEWRFRTLTQALPQIVWTATPEGRLDFCNDQLTEISGLNVQEACDQGWGCMLHAEDVAQTVAAWTRAVQAGDNYEIEHRLRQRDGTYRWFLSRGVPLKDQTGRIVKWFGSGTDIHDQKLAEQTLAVNHAAVENERHRLRAVLDVLPVAVFISDKEGRLTDVNPAVASVWGRLPVLSSSLEEFAEYYKGYFAKSGKPVSAQQRGLYRSLKRGESAAAEEMEFVRGDGKRGTVLNYAVPIRDNSGEIMGGVAVSVDITDLKRTQKQLMELNDALEQRVRERTRSLVTYQEHLRAMTSELVLTEQRERRRLATELHDYLAQLLVASKMKSKLVSNHIKTSGASSMEDLRGLIDESLKYTRTLIADLSPTILYEAGLFASIHWLGEQMQRHHLNVHIAQECEPVDMPDDKAVMIFQTVRELLFNVVKHAKVEEATVRLQQSSAGELVVSVEDAGVGFESPGQEFHPAGGKFGLFSVRERLVALGGCFEINSEPGRGTRGVVRVPLDPAVVDESSACETAAIITPLARKERVGRDTIRVLLVDDHKMVREGFRTLIECDAQLEVAGEAANGEEAIELTRLLQPDVVIMDINMPKMNGIEATRRIKLEMPNISVIGLSVHDDRGLIATMKEAGAYSYLTKGGPSEELCRAIHEAYQAQVNRTPHE